MMHTRPSGQSHGGMRRPRTLAERLPLLQARRVFGGVRGSVVSPFKWPDRLSRGTLPSVIPTDDGSTMMLCACKSCRDGSSCSAGPPPLPP